MILARHPAIKALVYGTLGVVCSAIGLWTPLEAIVICSVSFTVDGLAGSLLLAGKVIPVTSRWLALAVPFLGLFVGRSIAALIGY
ncbi:MAG: hypothetical protein NTZ05_05820 [Chloroflexi bacterium]|nr:hypothetical protein [Chloroflexota bacterium]